jgi:hypothetical protein
MASVCGGGGLKGAALTALCYVPGDCEFMDLGEVSVVRYECEGDRTDQG